MFEVILASLGVCLATGIAASAAYHVSARRARELEVLARFHEIAQLPQAGRPSAPGPSFPLLQALRSRLWMAGVAPRLWQLWALGAGLGAAGALGALRFGAPGALGGAALLVGALWLALRVRITGRQRRMLDQLPAFLDHVLRAVETGASVHNALRSATTESDEPLRGLFERVDRQVQRGAHLEDALVQLASWMEIRELRVFALTVFVNQRFGGSIRDLLRSVVETIRTQERMRREFRALTAETRISAWVLGLLPSGIGLYICAVNPDYLRHMQEDPVGRLWLAAALGLQAVGSLLLWRMVRSV